MRRVLLVAVLAALLLAPLFWLPSPGGEGIAEPLAAVMKDVRVVSQQSGKLLWSLQTGEARITGNNEQADMQGVEVTLPEEDMTVSALKGVYGLDDGSLLLSGEVHARTGGLTITTNEASLDSESGAIASNDRVIMEGKTFRIVAKGLRAKGGKVWLTNGVKAEFF